MEVDTAGKAQVGWGGRWGISVLSKMKKKKNLVFFFRKSEVSVERILV